MHNDDKSQRGRTIDDFVHRCRYEFAHVGSDALIQHGTDARFLVRVDEELVGFDFRGLPGRAFCCAARAPGHRSNDLIHDLIKPAQVFATLKTI